MQNHITQRIALLNDNGSLAIKGFATQMNIIYNREKVRSKKLKEWNFYQFIKGDYALQLTMGHLTYATSVSVNLLNIVDGRRWEMGNMQFFRPLILDLHPQKESLLTYKCKDFEMTFEVTESKRILTCKGSNEKYKKVEIYIEMDNDPCNEKMVIATPFQRKKQFYLNYKENYYRVTGKAQFDEQGVDFENGTGLIDWGRGVWPYKHQWFWGSISSEIDGVTFGLNIGWGFGDLSHATENMFFVGKKAYKLQQLNVERNATDYLAPWTLWDNEGNIQLYFTPFFDNYTQNKFVVVDTHCHQLYGKFSGFVMTEKGKLPFENIVGFIEHAVNRW